MKDERIQATANRFAARGFYIWNLLMSISLGYRALILKQHPRQWWDILAIWLIGIFFVFIAYARKGVIDHIFKRIWLTIFIVVFIVNLTLFFIIGPIPSFLEVFLYMFSLFTGMGLAIAIAYLLNRRWKRKEGIEDEE